MAFVIVLNPITGGLQRVLDESALAILNFKAGVADVASLPASSNTVNDARIVNDTHNLYIWNGSTWVDQGDIFDVPASTWGGITGTLSDQTDLQTALDAKLKEYDATEWINRSTPVSDNWRGTDYSASLERYVTVGDANNVLYSSDGITWISATIPGSSINWDGVVWAEGLSLFVAVASTGGSGDNVATSPDGITWTRRTTPASKTWIEITWSEASTLLVAVNADSANQVMTSPDGITWTARVILAGFVHARDIVWSPSLSLFVIVVGSSGPNFAYTSPDGITWTARTAPDRDWQCVTWSEELSLFVASGDGGSSTTRVMTSPDGITWTSRTTPSGTAMYDVKWIRELSLFVGSGGVGGSTNIFTSSDGITWNAHTSSSSNFILSLSWSAKLSLIVAVGGFAGSRIMTSYNPITETGLADTVVRSHVQNTDTQLANPFDSKKISYKLIDIGDWNMSSTDTVTVAHGLTSAQWKNIRSINTIIRNDADNAYYNLERVDGTNFNGGGIQSIDATNITLARIGASGISGFFESTDFDSTTYNRGTIKIEYEV